MSASIRHVSGAAADLLRLNPRLQFRNPSRGLPMRCPAAPVLQETHR